MQKEYNSSLFRFLSSFFRKQFLDRNNPTKKIDDDFQGKSGINLNIY